MSGAIVGVDVGGTFTDLILMEPETGAVRLAKVPSTPANQSAGVLAALDGAAASFEDVAAIIHGTTVTTNALLERKLSRCGLITTKGFRDILELGRRTRPNAYGLTGSFTPLIPRELRIEVPERMDADGEVLVSLDEAAVRAAAERLRDAGCDSLVIHFLHSYKNPVHEERALAIARACWPDVYVTAGHAILAEFREYERGVAAAVNACVQPLLHRYLDRLQGQLADRGFGRELLVIQGNGGSVSARSAAAKAVNTVLSGPASGVMAAAAIGRAAGAQDLVTFDAGGTSADVGLVLDGVPAITAEMELEHGMPIHVPMVDVHTVGAGGGSLARIDEAGLLQVGPESAGAEPGPICYGRGGDPADAHRRQSDPRPARSRRPARGGDAGRARRRAKGVRGDHRSPARPRCRGRGGGGHPHRQRPHGGRDPHGDARARPRPARLRALRLRRRGPDARRSACRRARHPPGDDPGAARASPAPSAASPPISATTTSTR